MRIRVLRINLKSGFEKKKHSSFWLHIAELLQGIQEDSFHQAAKTTSKCITSSSVDFNGVARFSVEQAYRAKMRKFVDIAAIVVQK